MFPSHERCSAFSGDPSTPVVTNCSANFPHPSTLGAQAADRERGLEKQLQAVRLELKLKVRWHASELKHQDEVRAAEREKADRERKTKKTRVIHH